MSQIKKVDEKILVVLNNAIEKNNAVISKLQEKIKTYENENRLLREHIKAMEN